jgi:hypothetical protein
MKRLLKGTYPLILIIVALISFNSCKKKNEAEPPPVINPTVNPIPYSVLVYLLTPTDKQINYDYYRIAKTTLLKIQSWYKTQMGNNKTFVLNPVVVDTLTGSHPSDWYSSNNGPEISGTEFFAFNNIKHDMKQLLGSEFDTTLYTFFVYVPSDFPDQTIPRGLAVEGTNNLEGLMGTSSNFFIGMDTHVLAHAFGLPEPAVETSNGIMSATGIPKWPNCVFTQEEKDTLNASPFLKVQ